MFERASPAEPDAGAAVPVAVVRRLMDAMPVGFYRSTPDGRFLYANPALAEILGYADVETFLATPALRLYHDPADRQRWLDEMDERGEVRGFEVRIRRGDGDTAWVRHTARPVRDASGQITCLEGVVEDVSEIREAEEERARETAFVRVLEEVAVAANEAIHPRDAYRQAVTSVCRLTGWPVGHVYLPDAGEPEVLRPGPAWHLDDEERHGPFRDRTLDVAFERGRGLPGEVARSGVPAWISDIRAREDFVRRDAVRACGLAAALAFPVLVGDDVVAVLEFFAAEPHEPDDRILEVAAQIGLILGRVEERHRATEEVRRMNAELEARVRERTAELRATVAELESFTYSVSHDLRTPLRAMAGFSEALLEDHRDDLDDEGRHFLERIQAGSHRMGDLITDLLTLSRISRKELEVEEVDLTGLARSVVRELRDSAPDRTVEVTIARGLTARGDRRLVRIALFNLLDNAWKYTGDAQSPRIDVGVQNGDGTRPFYVRDNGIGFDMKYEDKLFRAFERLHREPDYPGIGVGLATVDRIVRRHGGRAWAEAGPGAGATFYFTLGGEGEEPGPGPPLPLPAAPRADA